MTISWVPEESPWVIVEQTPLGPRAVGLFVSEKDAIDLLWRQIVDGGYEPHISETAENYVAGLNGVSVVQLHLRSDDPTAGGTRWPHWYSEGEFADYAITETPLDPSQHCLAIVKAINPLDALDRYAVNLGYVRYTDLEDPNEWIGVDRDGMFATFENTTIWSIPVVAPVDPITPKTIEQFIGDLLSHDDDVLLGLMPFSGARAKLILAAARRQFGGSQPGSIEPKAGVCGVVGPGNDPCLERLGHSGAHHSESHFWGEK